ncbi:MAG: AbrB/MazE/SpoVT family DNA-binding domain-containing protein [Oscillospiraceae bacterium]|nr:AbrB/MazE/SpoVT family DNA-binding domain-containing protein [Oscillospiraceae bacterium]
MSTMQNNVFIRKTDEQGRLVIPKSIRTRLEIGGDVQLEIIEGSDSFTVRRLVQRCVFCSATERLVEYMDKFVCSDCSKNLNK